MFTSCSDFPPMFTYNDLWPAENNQDHVLIMVEPHTVYGIHPSFELELPCLQGQLSNCDQCWPWMTFDVWRKIGSCTWKGGSAFQVSNKSKPSIFCTCLASDDL